MKKIIYLFIILSIILVGCQEPCNQTPYKVSYLKIGLQDKENVVYVRVEGSSNFAIKYEDLVQLKCSNQNNIYDIIAVDVSHYSIITEEEYNKSIGLTHSEPIITDTIITY